MPSHRDATETILDTFRDAWGTTTPITLPGEDFTPPEGEWVRVSINHTGAKQETLGPVGGRRFSRTGRVYVQIFTAANDGSDRSAELATTARTVFEGKTVSGVTFYEVIASESGVTDRWFMTVVSARFRYEETL